jgi:FkbM family methyltransferase
MKLPSTDTHFKPSDWDTYQLYQYEFALENTTARRTAVDCGAHVGIMTHRMCKNFYTTHAFEPQWHEYLEHNMQEYANWHLHTSLLSNTTGTQLFEVNSANTGNSSVSRSGTPRECTTLDSYELRGVDLIKIDVEGHELELLQGAERTIALTKPVLLVELEPKSPQRHEVERLLGDYGYAQILRKNADTVWTAK